MTTFHRLTCLIFMVLVTCSLAAAQDTFIPPIARTALVDLNARLGTTLDFETLDNWRWSEEGYTTTALGCETFPDPQPTPTVGHEVVLKHNGVDYRYYQPRDGEMYLCTDQGPQPLLPLGGAIDPLAPPTPDPFANCGVYPRLTVGSGGRVLANREDAVYVRAAPSPDAPVIGLIPPGAGFNVLEGPNCDTAYTYWRVDYNGLVGWSAEGKDREYFATAEQPVTIPDITGCVLEPRLSIGVDGRANDQFDGSINLRENPIPDANQIGEIPTNGVFRVLAGPVCHVDYNYWQVEYQGQVAWAAEGEAEGYYADPLGVLVDDLNASFVLPFTVGIEGEGRLIPDKRAEDAAEKYWEVVPQHVLFTLANDEQVNVGTIKIFRTSDYEAYYPGSIASLRDTLAQRTATIPDLALSPLYLTEAVHTFRTQETFLDLPKGGTMWHMVAGYAPDVSVKAHELKYLALGLSADGYYFYQIALDMTLAAASDEAGLPEATAEPVATAAEYVNYLQTTVIPTVTSTLPGDFSPSLEDLDRLVLSLEVAPEALPIRTFAQICGDLFQTRLTVGQSGRVLPGDHNNLRSETSTSSEKIGEIPGGATFDVLQGPVCDGASAWWQVHFEGLTGWTLEGQNPEHWVEPMGVEAAPLPFTPVVLPALPTLATFSGQPPTAVEVVPVAPNLPITCAGFLPSRLVVGQRGRVLPGDPNNLRSLPNAESEKTGQIPGGDEFSILEGPTCDTNGAWWRVDYNGQIGWTLEGQGDAYWLEPVSP